MTLLERIEGGVNKAGTASTWRPLGISPPSRACEQAVGTLDWSLPSLSDSASALRTLTERLSGVAIELATELPKATESLQEVSPELASVVGILDERFSHLDTVVTELARLIEAVVGTIPGHAARPARRRTDRVPATNRQLTTTRRNPWVTTIRRPRSPSVQATSVPIHDIGTAIYLSPDVFGWAAEWGWSNPFAFYFAGRGGMLGDVGADVVASAFGWFDPTRCSAMYTEGVGVAGATARRRGWPRRMRSGARSTSPTSTGWTTSSPSPRSWSTGSKARPSRSSSGGGSRPLRIAAGRAAQLMQILREWRGGLHLVATTAVGLSPLEAILTNEGEGQAKFFGWSEPFPDVAAIKAKHDEAEEITDRLCAPALAGRSTRRSTPPSRPAVHGPARRHAVAPRPGSPGGRPNPDGLE